MKGMRLRKIYSMEAVNGSPTLIEMRKSGSRCNRAIWRACSDRIKGILVAFASAAVGKAGSRWEARAPA